MCLLASGCYGQSSRPHELRVTAITAAAHDASASAQEGAPEICAVWHLTKTQAESFFAMSDRIDERTFRSEYDTAPCQITGTVEAEGAMWQFSINGAAKATWKNAEETRYFGCWRETCRPLVLWEHVGP